MLWPMDFLLQTLTLNTQSVGSVFPAASQIEDLHHIITAGDTDTFAIDFEYGSSRTRPNKQEVISAAPTMQVGAVL